MPHHGLRICMHQFAKQAVGSIIIPRIVIVHEAHRNNGWSTEVASRVCENAFRYLDASPICLGAKACPLPFNLGLEQAVIPSVDEIVAACRKTLYKA